VADRAATSVQVSAYRLAGGHAYQLTVRRRVKFDRRCVPCCVAGNGCPSTLTLRPLPAGCRHALSCRAFGYIGEIAVILFCFSVTTMIVVLLRSEPLRAEREAAGATMIWVVWLLALSTLGIGAFAVIRLVERWRKASSHSGGKVEEGELSRVYVRGVILIIVHCSVALGVDD